MSRSCFAVPCGSTASKFFMFYVVRVFGDTAADQKAPPRPIVGVYPTLPKNLPHIFNASRYYRYYQDWVEQFGASSVVLPDNGDVEQYFNSINALLFPGGASVPVPAFADGLIKRAIKAYSSGDYFPVWGTCLGFEWIIESFGGHEALETDDFDSVDLPAPANVIQPGRLFEHANVSLLSRLSNNSWTYEDHVDGIEPDHFYANSVLNSTFQVLATSSDRKGRPYVAAVQAKHMPIYGVQFHPEKVRYVSEHPMPGITLHIPKTPEARAVSDYLAEFLVSESRKNNHSPSWNDQTIPPRQSNLYV